MKHNNDSLAKPGEGELTAEYSEHTEGPTDW
jgi:hypothetical protein